MRHKQISSLILAVIFILQMFLPSVAHSSALTEEMDSVHLNKLTAIGIINEADADNVQYAETVSRAQYITYILRIAGYSADVFFDETVSPFEDVTDNVSQYKEIIAAYRIGLINEGTQFRPAEPITTAEALKIVVDLLGYKIKAQSLGGYPVGYLIVASELRLIGAGTATDTPLAPKDLFALLMKTLTTPVLSVDLITVYQQEISKRYASQKGKDLLYYVHNIEVEQGLLRSNEYTSLMGDREVGDDRVLIADTIYRKGSTAAAELLGYYVEALYRFGEDQPVLIYIGTVPGKNDVITVSSEDIQSVSVFAGRAAVTDSISQNRRSLSLSRQASLIYNGAFDSLSDDTILQPDATVTFIDNNSDGIYEVILVDRYRTIQVSDINLTNFIVSDQHGGKPIVLDPSDKGYDFVIKDSEGIVGFNAITKDSILSYAESGGKTKQLKRVIISTKTVKGSVEEISDDLVLISGKSYQLLDYMVGVFKVNAGGTFYLDYAGRIAAWKGEVDTVFGFLNKMAIKSGVGTQVEAQIFTENDRWVILNLKDRLKVNGEPCDAQTLYTEYLEKGYQELISYTVSEEGELISIDFAKKVDVDFQPFSPEEEQFISENRFRLSYQSDRLSFRSTTNSLDGKVSLSGSTKIFCIPSGTEPSLDKFMVLNRNNLIPDFAYTNIKSYNANLSGFPEACVVDGDQISMVTERASLQIVAGKSKKLNRDGQIMRALKLFYSNEKIGVTVSELVSEKDYDAVSEGDIIQCSFDNKGNILGIAKRYSTNGGANQKFLLNNIYSGSTLVAGEIKCFDYQNSAYVLDYGSTTVTFSTIGIGSIYIYNRQHNTIRRGSVSDLRKGVYCFARVVYLQTKEMVLFE